MSISRSVSQWSLPRHAGEVSEHSRRSCQQRAQPDQVVGRGGEGHDPIDERVAAMSQLAQPTDGLQPAEDLLDEFPSPLTDGVARVPRGPAVDGAAFHLLRDVRRETQRPDGRDETRDVEALVAPDGPRLCGIGQQPHRRLTFRGTGGGGHTHLGHQAMPIVEQHVAGIRQLRLASGAFSCELGVGIGRRLMRVIPPRFPVEIDRGIARIVGRRGRPRILATKALEAGPGLQQASRPP